MAMIVNITQVSADTALIAFSVTNLDAGNVKTFREAIQPVTDANTRVLIDMGSLNFVDSSGLGALLSCLRAMGNKNGKLALFGMTKPVRALFELVRMHRIFAIYDSYEAAQAA